MQLAAQRFMKERLAAASARAGAHATQIPEYPPSLPGFSETADRPPSSLPTSDFGRW